MDITSIASQATDLSQTNTAEVVGVTILKKAIDQESAGALALINALPQMPAAPLPPHLGQLVNTTA